MFCYCIFPEFSPIFTSNSAVLIDGGANSFLPLGAGYPSYTTANVERPATRVKTSTKPEAKLLFEIGKITISIIKKIKKSKST